jgi:hypothetical protein
LDGVVERDENGKEVRYPVMLRAEEKIIAKKIVLSFKVCVNNNRLLINEINMLKKQINLQSINNLSKLFVDLIF